MIAGLIASPILGAVLASFITSEKKSTRVFSITTGLLVGLLLAPFISIGGFILGALGGGYLGYKTGKDWLDIPEREPIHRLFLFKKSILLKQTKEIVSTSQKVVISNNHFFPSPAKPTKNHPHDPPVFSFAP